MTNWRITALLLIGSGFFVGLAAQGCSDSDRRNGGAIGTVNSLTVTTTTLPSATVGAIYSQQLTVVNATAPVAWTITGGALHSGLSLNQTNGIISGTPTAAGTSSFIVRATDANSQFDEQQLALIVENPGAGASDFAVTVSGGTTPTYSWADNAGRASSVSVARVAAPATPVWSVSTPGVDNLTSPVIHGTVPVGATNAANTEPVLTTGVQYRVTVTEINGSRTGFATFTP